MMKNTVNVDRNEINKFEAIAASWWDPHGATKPLHDINPLRLGFITQQISLQGKTVLDIGCGGGILTESMASQGAFATGIDMANTAIIIARLHASISKLVITYQETTAEAFATQHPASFDIVTCMELLEHVPHPEMTIAACATLVKPGGQIFFSTLNRNVKAYLHAIIGAEYLLGLLPKGTHDYAKFIKPSELDRFARSHQLTLKKLTGMTYNPLTRRYSLCENDVDVNYLAHYTKS